MASIAVPIRVATADDVRPALSGAAAAARGGADLVEWRVDRLATLDSGAAALEEIVRESPLPSIVTCRAADEGGEFSGKESERVSLLHHLADAGAVPAYVDVEYARWTASGDLAATTSALRRLGSKLILSAHDFAGRPPELQDVFQRIHDAAESDVTKVAWVANSVLDDLECAAMLEAAPRPTIALCMGAPGLLTRVFAGLWGGLLTFAALEPGAGSAPGQPTLGELRSQYRMQEIDSDTELVPVFEADADLKALNARLREQGRNAVALPLGHPTPEQLPALREALSRTPFLHIDPAWLA